MADILLAEDDRVVRKTLVAMLEGAGAVALPGMPPEGAWAEALIT